MFTDLACALTTRGKLCLDITRTDSPQNFYRGSFLTVRRTKITAELFSYQSMVFYPPLEYVLHAMFRRVVR
jgi:hypothetical protein